MVREQLQANGGADAVGADDQVGLQLAVGGADTGGAVVVTGIREGRVGRGADGALGELCGQALDEGGPVEQDQRAAEASASGGGAGPREPAAARGPQSSVALPGGEVADLVAETDDVQGAQGVGREGDAGADRFQRTGPLQDGDPPAAPVQRHRRGETPDAAADDDGAR